MITRIFFFLIGYALMVLGFSYTIIYINLLSFGFTMGEYLKYISMRYECWMIIIGFIIIIISLFGKGKKHDKCIRYSSKFIR